MQTTKSVQTTIGILRVAQNDAKTRGAKTRDAKTRDAKTRGVRKRVILRRSRRIPMGEVRKIAA